MGFFLCAVFLYRQNERKSIEISVICQDFFSGGLYTAQIDRKPLMNNYSQTRKILV